MKKEFFGLLCGCTLLPAFLHAQTERPNIVIVLADDTVVQRFRKSLDKGTTAGRTCLI